MTGYTVVRRETPGEHLTGAEPVVLARRGDLSAYLLERVSDGRRFVLIGATADEHQARAWADGVLEARVCRSCGHPATDHDAAGCMSSRRGEGTGLGGADSGAVTVLCPCSEVVPLARVEQH